MSTLGELRQASRSVRCIQGMRFMALSATGLAALAFGLGFVPLVVQDAGATQSLERRSKGSPTAPVTVYEMSDFQCPYCRQFALETFPQLERDYIRPGKVRWVFINFPLTSVHQHASAAAQLALCAAKQEKFWRVHDLLFQHQGVWAPLKEAGPFFVSLGDSAGLSKTTLLTCLQAPETLNEVRADAEGAARSGAASTPTFYIEGGLLEGAQPVGVFRHALDSIYAAKKGKGAKPPGEGAR